mgnify:CR=1 FL=1
MSKQSILISDNWIPCNIQMPIGDGDEIQCLVTCREWDIFQGKWGELQVCILSYSLKMKMWNTKSDVEVFAWMPLPSPFVGTDL